MIISLLPYDIIIKIFLNLNIIEAKNLSCCNNYFKYIYEDLKKKNQYLPLDEINLFKNCINKGFRFIKINNNYYKIINVIEYFNDSHTIMFKNGFMLNIYENHSLLFNSDNKRKYIKKKV